MARKKILYVIVEGPSDEIALRGALEQVFGKDKIHVEIVHGDITTKKGVSPKNIVNEVGNMIKGYAESRHFRKEDFSQIIHIVDTDGAYISDDKIVEDTSLNGLRYTTEGIYSFNVQSTLRRNKTKRDNLLKLRRKNTIWELPYRVYYMSCNLDHVLYNKLNSTDEEKENDAYDFAKKYKDNLEEFVEYICESNFAVKMEYSKSWEFIEKDTNSLCRYTNLGLCILEEIEKQKKARDKL